MGLIGHMGRPGEAVQTFVLGDLVEFAIGQARGRCFAGWQRDWVREYLGRHLEQGTLAWVRERDRIVAVGCGWQLNACETVDPGFAERPWRWQSTNPRGDTFFIADVIGARAWLFDLLQEFFVRYPHWRKLRLMALRRGRLVEYDAVKLAGKLQDRNRERRERIE